jgi:hypothetical protein
MSRTVPDTWDLAGRLIAYETSRDGFLVVEKLRPNLATLMGKAGFRALISRALALATSNAAGLRTVHVGADGSFEGLNVTGSQATAREIAEGGVVLLSELLGLLMAFIGEGLTLRLLRDVWPELPLDDWESGGQE